MKRAPAAPAAAPSAELAVAVDAAHAAGALLRRHFERGVEAEWKGRRDLVTVADRDAEAVVRRHLAAAFPDDLVVGEEGEELPEAAVRGRRRWYVDPLDGTTNFVKGQPRWAVAVAFCDESDIVQAAVVHVPTAGETFRALRGQGAWCGEKVVRASTDLGPAEALAMLGPLSRASRPLIEAVAAQVLSVRITGSTVCDLVDVACGRAEAYLGVSQGRWDLAAGVLIAVEAGAVATNPGGEPLHGPAGAAFVGVPLVHEALRGAVAAAAAAAFDREPHPGD